ncbi:PmeII family type II restriction endonuclease [Rothia nasimurium]|uniref:PmeII family type II restriction endonuclease n=1 Tax=Rothia nasimurium TaxID=85336 RepID=UPI001F3FD0FD|nr:PmeII family type II restriction endonuclease [Rothia nasimurium]
MLPGITPMTENEKEEILNGVQEWFSENIASKHGENTKKASKLNSYKYNPFLINYLAKFAFGEVTAENIAKVLVYPRVMGTSINTSFGQNIQNFISQALPGYASLVSGLDIEFFSKVDGKKKFCQLKAGPETINKDDIASITGHFKSIRNLARTNQYPDFNADRDCVVGVLYGERDELNSHYRKINEDYQVLIGQEFWYHLTGDSSFYSDIIKKFEECAESLNSSDAMNQSVKALTEEIKREFQIFSGE